MGYVTSFDGHLELNKPLDEETVKLIEKYELDCKLSYSLFYASIGNDMFDFDDTVTYSSSYVKIIRHVMKHILKPKGYVVNGRINWNGVDMDDKGKIDVKDNKVSKAVVSYEIVEDSDEEGDEVA